MADKTRMAWFSSVNNGISAYASALLLPHLSSKYDITLFSSDSGQIGNLEALNYLSAFKLHDKQPFDIFFYQFEDTQASYFSRAHLGLMPGIVWFHDFLLLDSGPEPFYTSPWEETLSFLSDECKEFADRSKNYIQKKPHAYREAGLSVIPVFSSERAHDEYKRHIEKTISFALGMERQSYYLPIPIRGKVERTLVNDNLPCICFCGSVQLQHRAHKLLQALSNISTPFKLKWLVEKGEVPRASELLKEFSIQNYEICDPKSPQAWEKLIGHSNIAVHTLFSVYGSVSPYLEISMAAGLPCIVTDFGNSEYLSEDICIKIEPGEKEAQQLASALSKLLLAPSANSTALQDYCLDKCSVENVAAELNLIFERALPNLIKTSKAWAKLEQAAKYELFQEIDRLSQGSFKSLRRYSAELGWCDAQAK